MNYNTKEYNCECFICGKLLKRYPSNLKALKDGKPVCSRKCMGIKNTQIKRVPKYECFVCGKKFHRSKNQIDRLKDKRLTCSRQCYKVKSSMVEKEKLENKLGVKDLGAWLHNKYNNEKMNSRDIALIIYGKKHFGPNVIGWMDRLGIDRRDRSEAVALQWKDNPERRIEQAEFMKLHLGKGTPARDKIIKTMQTDEYKLKQSISKTGERNGMFGVTGKNHPMWNPNLTSEQRVKDRKTFEYSEWRTSVYEKDGYTCQVCFLGRGGNLVAHHLNGYNWDVENRFNVSNGVTLCEPCHVEFHKSYGFGNNTKKQYEQYKDNVNPKEYKEQLAFF